MMRHSKLLYNVWLIALRSSCQLLIQKESDSLKEPAGVKRFLMALDELGLPGFELSDLDQGSMVPVLQCLETLKSHFAYNATRENIKICSRKRWEWDQPDLSFPETNSCLKDASKSQHIVDGSVVSDGITSIDHVGLKSNELFQLKRGFHVDFSDAKLNELLKSNNLDSVSTRLLFNIGNRILSYIFERKNGDVPQAQRAACLLRNILQVIELRFSNQAENMKIVNLTFSFDRDDQFSFYGLV